MARPSERCFLSRPIICPIDTVEMPMRLREVVGFVSRDPCCPRQFMRCGTEMRSRLFDQRDMCPIALAEPVTIRVANRARRRPADDNDAMKAPGLGERSLGARPDGSSWLLLAVWPSALRVAFSAPPGMCAGRVEDFPALGLGIGFLIQHLLLRASLSHRTIYRRPPSRRRCRSDFNARASDMKRSMPKSAQARDGNVPTAESVAASTMKPLRNPAAPLEVSRHAQQSQLLRERHRRISRLRHEHGSHRQIDRRSIEIERVTGRDHEAHRRFSRRVLELGHHARQRLGR